MSQIKTTVKKWGNSLGVILPKKIIDNQEIKEGIEVEITLISSHKTKVGEIFGSLKGKLKRKTQEILDEVDKELYPDG